VGGRWAWLTHPGGLCALELRSTSVWWLPSSERWSGAGSTQHRNFTSEGSPTGSAIRNTPVERHSVAFLFPPEKSGFAAGVEAAGIEPTQHSRRVDRLHQSGAGPLPGARPAANLALTDIRHNSAAKEAVAGERFA
jgi:hypothetical protein